MPANNQSFFLNHTGMAVPNLHATIEWYERVFAFQVTSQFSTKDFKAAFIEREGARLEIFEAIPAPAAEATHTLTPATFNTALLTKGYTHVAFGVPDVDAAFQEAVSRGADAIVQPVSPPAGPRFGYVGDLNGQMIELIQYSQAQIE